MHKKPIVFLVVIGLSAIIFILIKYHKHSHNLPVAPRISPVNSAVAAFCLDTHIETFDTTARNVMSVTLESQPRGIKIESPKPDNGLRAGSANVGYNELIQRMNLAQAFRILWNPFEGKMSDQGIDLLQIGSLEIVAIQDAFDKWHAQYAGHMATQSSLIAETDTEVTFRVANFSNMGEMADQEFLDNIKTQVSAATFALLADGMPVFAQYFGHGLGLNSYYQEITISKIPDSDRFRLEVASKDVNGRKVGTHSIKGLRKQAISNFGGQMIVNNNSHILD